MTRLLVFGKKVDERLSLLFLNFFNHSVIFDELDQNRGTIPNKHFEM